MTDHNFTVSSVLAEVYHKIITQLTSMSSSLSPDTPLVGPLPLTPLQQPAVEVVASSAEPAAAGMFLLDLGRVLKTFRFVTQNFFLHLYSHLL